MSVQEIIERAEADILQSTGQRVRLIYRKELTPMAYRKKEELIDLVLMVVASIFRSDEDKVRSKTRQRSITQTRFAVYSIVREFGPITLKELAKYFDCDHTTVIHGLKHCLDYRETEPDYAAKYNEAKRIIEEINA